MSVVYAAIHAFENAVRAMVMKAMGEKHGATWRERVPERIRKTSKTRMEEDAKYRWHGARGEAPRMLRIDAARRHIIVETGLD